MADHQPYVTIRSRRPAEGPGSRTGPPMVRNHGSHLYFDLFVTYTITLRLHLVEEIVMPDLQHTTQAVPVSM